MSLNPWFLDDADLAFAKGTKNVTNQMFFFIGWNPEPKATGIVQDQLDPPQRTLGNVATDDSWEMSASFLNSIPSSTTTNGCLRLERKIMSQQEEMKTLAS